MGAQVEELIFHKNQPRPPMVKIEPLQNVEVVALHVDRYKVDRRQSVRSRQYLV